MPGLPLARFLNPVPRWLICPICNLVLDRPTLLCTSEHAVCESCIDNCPTTKKREVPKCPICTMVFNPDEVVKSVVLERQVGGLLSKCDYIDCPWIGPLHDVPQHIYHDCAHVPRACPHASQGCTFSAPTATVNLHLLINCPFAEIPCPRGGADCGGEGKGLYRRSEGYLHYPVCTMHRCSVPDCPTKGSFSMLSLHTPHCSKLHTSLQTAQDDLEQLKTDQARWLSMIGSATKKALLLAGAASEDRVQELEKMVEERDERIRELEELLGMDGALRGEETETSSPTPSLSPESGRKCFRRPKNPDEDEDAVVVDPFQALSGVYKWM
ncbi:hypothetical protein BCR35DRAFT_335686 [Leucosporidium creatinivorum]|uniref:RING-type domain-containing protein n=1 Tax=Leucosporidium creatinivorum TaxID=106004 RepID=A0A1Y2D6V0_9BASI|nr:hypothetical protein BCR35DRAFT_335686 [Leucosporidium creatinivorum]